jgi:hypothetical protein
MESVKGNSDRKQNVQMRWLIDDPQSREEPLKILEQKVSVFKEPEHAQIHTNACDQPATSCMLASGFGHFTAKPKIHRGGPEQQPSKRRVPGAVKNITGYDEQIFPRLPRMNAPVKSDNDHEENDERERIKEHGEAAVELRSRERGACYASHIEADV